MNRRVATLLIALAAGILLLTVYRLVTARRGDAATAPEAATPPVEALAAEPFAATLWLPSESGRLADLPAELAAPPTPEGRASVLLAALFAATPDAPLTAVFPQPVEVGHLLLTDGTAWVDLRSPAGGEPPSSGSTVELLRVYAIVHTLVRNLPEVSRVVLLWNGVQRQGFPGHVDTGHPLVPLAALKP